MAIKAGDVVMDFLADLSQLDEGLDKAEEKVEKWQDKVKGLNEEQAAAQAKMWAEPAKKAEEAGEKVAEVASSSAAAATQAQTVVTSAVEASAAAGGKLAAGVELAGAALEGVGVAAAVAGGAIVAAFATVIVAAFAEALASGAKGLHDWYTGINSIELAWQKYDQTVFSASQKIQNEINKQQEKIIEMTGGPVAALDFALKHLESTADSTFQGITKGVDEALKAMKESYSFLGLTNAFKDSSTDLEIFRNKLAEVMRLAEKQAAPGDTTAAYRAGIDLAAQKERELTATINQRTAASGLDAHAATDGLHAERKAINEVYDALKKGMELDETRANVIKQQSADKSADLAAESAKRSLDQQLAQIELWKARQHEAREAGKTDAAAWAVAEVRAAQAADMAHEDYLKKLIVLYARSGDVIKLHATQQELATLQTKNLAKETEALSAAMEKHHAATQKVIQDYAALMSAAINKESQNAINLANERVKAQALAIDTEIQNERAASDQKVIILQGQYNRGLISGKDYLTQLKALYAEDVAAITAMLNRKQQLVILEAQNTARKHGQILTDEQAKELKGYQDIEKKKQALTQDFDAKFLKAQETVTNRIAKNYATIGKLLDDYAKKLRAAQGELTGFSKVANATLNGVTDAFGSAISAWLSGQASFGQAMEQALAQYLIQVASKAAIDALYFTAWGIADLFWNPARAGADFAAAGEFAAIAGVAGAAGKALAGAASSGSQGGGASSTGGTSTGTPNAATQPAQNPVVVQNTARLAAGGLVTRETSIVAGDGMGGGDAMEGVIPLTNPRAMREIASAIAAHMPYGGGGDHYHIKGDVVDHAQLSRKISRQVKRGKARLTAANSLRLTRRS